MKTPSIRRSLLFRCGIGVGTLLCLLSATIYLLVRHSIYREMDQSITQTAALLANQVELERGNLTFEWQEGLGSNDALTMEGLFQFWDDHTNATTRSPALRSNDLPKFRGDNGSPLVKAILLPNGDRGRAVGLRVYPFVLPEEAERMLSQGQVIDPKGLPHTCAKNSRTSRNMRSESRCSSRTSPFGSSVRPSWLISRECDGPCLMHRSPCWPSR
jgi:hypothetical protein